MPTLSRTHLANLVAGRTGLPEKDVDTVLNALVDVMRDAIKNDDRVTIRFLGSFRKRVVKARTFMSGLTGKQVSTTPRDTIRFTPSVNF